MWTTGALKGHFQRIGLKLLKEKSTNSYTSTGCQFVLFKVIFVQNVVLHLLLVAISYISHNAVLQTLGERA